MLERVKLEEQTLRRARGRNPQEVFDYFAGEIFSKGDRETKDVLLQTAFLTRVTASMAVELTGLANAGHIIDGLAQEHYFTNKHDSMEPAYQYHPLFREFLLAHARQTFTRERRVQIQQAAAALLEKAGQIEDAALLLRDAEDWETLARLIQEQAPNLVGQGRGQTVEQWLAGLPEPIFQERQWLLYWRGISRTPFNLREGRGYLEKAFDLFRSQRDSSGAFLASSAVVVNLIQETDDLRPIDKWIDLIMELRDSFRAFPSIEIEARVTIAMILAMTARQPHHEELSTWVERGEELSRTIQDPGLRTTLMIYLTCYYYWIGDFTRISVGIEPLRDIARSNQVPIADRLMAFMFIGRNEWLTVSPAAGIATIAGALALAETTGVHVLNRQMLFDCAVASLNNGDLATAERYLQEVRPMLEKLARCDLASYHYVSALCALLKGNLSIASGHEEKGLKLAIETGMPLFEAICRLLSAQVLHECNKDNAAQVHVVKSLQLARKGRARFVEYMGLLTEAQMALDLGNERKGLEALSKAMTLGRENGYINTFTWRADVMARLCAKALEAGIEVEYVQQLIRKRGLIVERPSVEIEQWPWAIKIYTLGRFSLIQNDQPVRFSRKAQRRPIDLLKALIAFGGRSVSESQVIEALWPEAHGDVAHQSLSTTLHRLRRLLGRDETIRRQEGKLSLDDRLCWVDIWAVEHLLTRAETVTSQTQRNGDVWPEVGKISRESSCALPRSIFGRRGNMPGRLAWQNESSDGCCAR